MNLYLGLMSGTSLDGIDAVLVDLESTPIRLLHQSSSDFSAELQDQIQACLETSRLMAIDVWRIDSLLAEQFAQAALACLESANIHPSQVSAIGCHGQTIYHAPHTCPPITVQLGDANIIAQRCGITTVADFRRRDVAAGGEGAPLAPGFHRAMFSKSGCERGILNLGGIANISLLAGDLSQPVTGFDTGPANTLLDQWYQRHYPGKTYDTDGKFAASGNINESLLEDLLDDPYFKCEPPKSTGREYFNLEWLESRLPANISPADVQCTLCALTVRSVHISIASQGLRLEELYVCGGGALNPVLMDLLRRDMAPCSVHSTAVLGLPPKAVEGAAFAWLARECLQKRPANQPSVTGAIDSVVLGGIYQR